MWIYRKNGNRSMRGMVYASDDTAGDSDVHFDVVAGPVGGCTKLLATFEFPITAVIPFVEMALLHCVKDGWLVSKEQRDKSNAAIDRHLQLLSFFNIAETAGGLL